MRSLVLLLTAVCAAPAAFPTDADVDFSGSWKLVEAESRVRALPERPPSLLRIEHRDHAVRCQAFPAANASPESWVFFDDGKEKRTKLSGRERSSVAKWEGSALLVNTIVTRVADQYTEMDRWKRSRDGHTLTIRRQVVSAGGQTESTLVYERAQ